MVRLVTILTTLWGIGLFAGCGGHKHASKTVDPEVIQAESPSESSNVATSELEQTDSAVPVDATTAPVIDKAAWIAELPCQDENGKQGRCETPEGTFEFRNGVRHGVGYAWHKSGAVKMKQVYNNGVRTEQRTWYDDGKIESVSERTGTRERWKRWLPDGVPSSEGQYETGLRTGKWRSGNPVREGHYTEGMKEGLWRRWYTNGQLRSEGHFAKGKRVGVWRTWNESGQLLEEGEFVEGKKVGSWQYWENGKARQHNFDQQ